MTNKEIIVALLIHVFVPVAGLLFFFRLKGQMERDKTQNPPILELFIIFANYGGLLLVLLTSLLWQWSGMASLGTFYLILVAPFIMGIIASKYRNKRAISTYHNWTYFSGLSYFVIAPAIIIALLLLGSN